MVDWWSCWWACRAAVGAAWCSIPERAAADEINQSIPFHFINCFLSFLLSLPFILIDAPREKTINGKKSETHQSSFNSKNEEIDWASFLFFPRGSLQSTNWKCFICWWRSKAMAQPTNNNLFFFLTALARADKRREELLGLPRQLELPWCPAWWRRSTPFTNQIKLKFNLLLWIGSLHLRSLCFVLIDLNEFNWFCLFVCLLFAEHWARCGP